MRTRGLVVLALVLGTAVLVQSLTADTLKLKDGSKVEGRVIPQGADYWVKLPDGTTRTISRDSVAEWIKGDSAAVPPTGSAPAAGATPGKPAGLTYHQTKAKADRSEIPLAAVATWQTFIDANAGSTDL